MCNVLKESDMQLLESGEPDFDLQKEYDEANRKYFDGELKPVPLMYKKMSGKFGVVSAAVYRRRHVVSRAEIKFLAINSIYKYTREQFLSTFLHEMCHVKMLQNPTAYNWVDGYHGRAWQEIAKEVSAASGIDITEDESGMDYQRREELKPYVVIMKKDSGRDYMSMAFTSLGIWNKRGDGWHYRFNPDHYVTVFTTTDTRPAEAAVKSTSKVTFYKMPLDVAMDVLKNKRLKTLYAHKPGESPDSRSKQVVRALQGESEAIGLTRNDDTEIQKALDEIRALGYPNPLMRNLYIHKELPAAFEVSSFDGALWIDSVAVFQDHNGKGYASKVLDQILRIIDKYKITAKLHPEPYGNKQMKKSALIAWYKRHGFKKPAGGYSEDLIYVGK